MSKQTPEKKKAIELLNRFCDWDKKDAFTEVRRETAKECALICVDEMLKDSVVQNIGDVESTTLREQWRAHWQQVKKEIELI